MKNKIYDIQQDSYVPGAEEKDLYMILNKITRGLQGSLKNFH